MGRPRFNKRRQPEHQPPAHKPGDGEIRWVGGVHSVEETLRSKPQNARELWVEHEQNAPSIKDIIGLARRHEIPVRFMGRPDIDRAMSGGRHQGVALKVFFEFGEGLNNFLDNLMPDDKAGLVLVAIDQIQDPHNLGAIARSALNLGAKGLILPDRRTSPVTAVAVASSAGAIQKIPVHHVVNLATALERCRDEGFWIYGADGAGTTVWDVRITSPLVLVIGSEGYGLRPTTQKLCHEMLAIPQAKGGVESLNASCAASVLLYEIARQLRAAP
jgi:23S rRNA (guanosine2251-2'-O)-methyltransferase